MSRQAIPSFAMSEIGRESLRREGVVVTTLAYWSSTIRAGSSRIITIFSS